MKLKYLSIATLLLTFTLFSHLSFAQSDTKTSVKNKTIHEEASAEIELQQNIERQKDADALQKEYKAKAKETSRINDEAEDAAKHAKRSAKMEKKAQKARVSADKQLEKSNKAADKSNRNNP
jgi:hypothetical protein